MIPKLNAKGSSFKGLAAYLLHDKEAATSGRVAWVETLNMVTHNPETAWRVMAATAMNAGQLKEQAGVKKTGRSSKDAVMHLSLSWDPEQKPTREEMSDFARRALAALKAEDRQAMVICHSDAKHPHVHVIVNRVSPTDGRMLSSSKEKLALSELALAYEKEGGTIYCKEREINAAKRAKGEYVRAEKDIPQPEYEALKEAQAQVISQITPQMRQQNPQAAATVRARMRKQFRAYLDGIKENLRPEWRKLYERQRKETAKAIQEKTSYLDKMLGLFDKRKAASPALVFQSVTGKASWDASARQQKQRGERAGIARSYVAQVGKAIAEIKFNCQAAIRQLFVAHDKGGASPAFGPTAAGMTPDQAQTQRRVTQLSEKFKQDSGGRPHEKWERPKSEPQPRGSKGGKGKDLEKEPE